MFSKIWKDSVWSKIISAGIIGLLTIIYHLLEIRFGNGFVFSKISTISNFNINISTIITAIIFLIAFLWIIGLKITIKTSYKYDEESLNIDRKLFKQISDQMIDLVLDVKGNGFSGRPVKSDRIETMIDFLHESLKPDFVFLNPQLDDLKNDVVLELNNLDSILSKYIFGTNDHDWVSIPSEWEYNQYDRLIFAKKEIQKQEDVFTDVYQKFIVIGKRILKV